MPYIKNPSFHPHPQLSRLVAPLPARKRRELEHRLSRCNHSTPIRIWKNYILVDFESYDYCQKHKITVDVSYLAFRNEEEATIWICKNQYNREDISDEMQRYIIGRRFTAEKTIKNRKAAAIKQLAKEQMQLNGTPSVFLPPDIIYDNTQATLTEMLGSEYHVAPQTVRKYAVYASMIDQLYDTEPAFTKKILQGEIYIGHDSLAEVTAMNAGELSQLCKYFLGSTERRPSYTKYKAMLESGKKKPQKQPPSAGSIKEMPEYDPDSEVSSLTLTIPSWIGSIQRAERNSDFSRITERAREKLIAELVNLIHIADNTIISLKEKRHG